jgi:maltose alpha-D-glucosyltransferase/alpha-amylase
VELDLRKSAGLTPVEMLGQTEFPRIGEAPYILTMWPYGFFWFRLERAPAALTTRTIVEPAPPAELMPALFAGEAWDTLLQGNVRTLLERDYLLPFLRQQRWFGGRSRTPTGARLVDWSLLSGGHEPVFLTIVEVGYADGSRERCFVPLSLRANTRAERLLAAAPQALLAPITGARKGALIDAAADGEACLALVRAIGATRRIGTLAGTVAGSRTGLFDEITGSLPVTGDLAVRRPGQEHGDAPVILGDRLIMKLFRWVVSGPNPDVEVGTYLTERAGFKRVPALAGTLDYQARGQSPTNLAMLQRLLPSQATGWDHALAELGRYFERAEPRHLTTTLPARDRLPLAGADEILPPLVLDTIGPYIETAGTLGRRTGELHLALARETSDPAFAAEPFTAADRERLADAMRTRASGAMDLLARTMERLPDRVRPTADRMLQQAGALQTHFQALRGLAFDAARIRIHGDYHLEQVLWAENDFFILDFEGEPWRPIEERRAKRSPLEDVAGMLRSFNSAAFAALLAYTATRPELRDRLDPWAQAWAHYTSAVFLRTYLSTVAGSPIMPSDRQALEGLLEAFVLDTAVSELCYELNTRPDRAWIPLRGILPLLG